MKGLILILLFLLSSSLKAQRYNLRTNLYNLITHEKLRLPLSKNCKNCLAEKSLMGKAIIVEVKSGQNPGAMVCKKIRGTIIFVKDKLHNDITLCLFKDGSYTTTGALSYSRLRRPF